MGFDSLIEKAREFDVPESRKALKIAVIGCGGSGNNTITRLKKMGLDRASTVAINTDSKHLYSLVSADRKVLIGRSLTKGMGAGGDPSIGERAAEYSFDEIEEAVGEPDIAFITAGMGGGTGTGSAPIAAEIAKKAGAVVIAMVTKPFSIEGGKSEKAKYGIRRLKEVADSVITLENDRLIEIVPNLPVDSAFMVMDTLVADVIKNITDALVNPSTINIDFADFKRVMSEGGDATILYGENSAREPSLLVKETLSNRFLNTDFHGASAALVHLTVGTSGPYISTVDKVMKGLTRDMGQQADIIMGIRNDPDFEDRMKVLMVVTGIGKDDVLGTSGSGMIKTRV